MINNSLPRKSIQMCFNCSQTKKLRTFEMGRQNQQCSTKTITTSCQEHVQTSKDRQENAMKERTQFFSSTRHHVSCKGLWASLQAVGPLISPSFISRVCKEYNYLKDFFLSSLTPSLPQDAWTCLHTVYFRVLWHICLQCCAFWWKSFHMPMWKRRQKLKGFIFCTFIGHF